MKVIVNEQTFHDLLENITERLFFLNENNSDDTDLLHEELSSLVNAYDISHKQTMNEDEINEMEDLKKMLLEYKNL